MSVPPSDAIDETIDRVCRGVASVQEGERVRIYIEKLKAATPGAIFTGEDSVGQTAESSRPRELLPSKENDENCSLCDGTGEVNIVGHGELPCPECISREFAAYRASHETGQRLTREGWYRFNDGWHPIQQFALRPGEDEAHAVQGCFMGQRVEFRGSENANEQHPDPGETSRWICDTCETVNSIHSAKCGGCALDRGTPNYNLPPWHLSKEVPGCHCDGCRTLRYP